MKFHSKATHETKYVAAIDRHELKNLVGDYVLRDLGIDRKPNLTIEIKFEDAKEGSPPYVVGTQAFVTVTIDHNQETKP